MVRSDHWRTRTGCIEVPLGNTEGQAEAAGAAGAGNGSFHLMLPSEAAEAAQQTCVVDSTCRVRQDSWRRIW